MVRHAASYDKENGILLGSLLGVVTNKYYHHHCCIQPDSVSKLVTRSDYLNIGVLLGRPLLVTMAFLQLSWAEPDRRGKTPQGEPREPGTFSTQPPQSQAQAAKPQLAPALKLLAPSKWLSPSSSHEKSFALGGRGMVGWREFWSSYG